MSSSSSSEDNPVKDQAELELDLLKIDRIKKANKERKKQLSARKRKKNGRKKRKRKSISGTRINWTRSNVLRVKKKQRWHCKLI
jgi:hypothetical protein